MEKLLEFINTYLFGPSLPIVIMVAGVYLFFRYGSFIIFRKRAVISVLLRKNGKEGISPFKTAMLALASTLGVGNIVGVSTAIISGGPGAVFWLTVSAFAAMPLKYGEVVLGMLYRRKEGGEYRGGAMYYMRDGMNSKKLSVLFAVLCIVNALTVGNIVQVKAFSDSFVSVFGGETLWVGAVLALVVFFSLQNGTGRVTEITSRLIPAATLVYVGVSLVVIGVNFTKLPTVFSLIMNNAFNLRSAAGGIGGYTVMRAVRYGVARGIMSNEAGSGTSPTAHAKSNIKSPTEQGFWGIFEVFADTVVMCNITALVILLSFDLEAVQNGVDGMELVLISYGVIPGNFSQIIIALSVMLFAYATVICQGFYGGESIYSLTKNKTALRLYRLFYCVVCVYGAVADNGFIWSITDFNISLMTVINTFCVVIMSKTVKDETDKYFLKSKKDQKKLPHKA